LRFFLLLHVNRRKQNMKRQRKTQAAAAIVIMAMAILVCMPFVAFAGSLEPSAPPTAGTMHTLEDIYQKLLSIETRLTAIEKQLPRFTDNGNGTVTDTKTNLIWLKNANPLNGAILWADAVTYCNTLASGKAGLTDGSVAGDWRLPSKEELEGIGTDPPATWYAGVPSVAWKIPGAPFSNVQAYIYWSSTSYAESTDKVWIINLPNGEAYYYGKALTICHVWPVRGGNN
jgi:hypothetical protein